MWRTLGWVSFADFCIGVGLKLAPFQRKIVKAILGPQRETLVLLPRGNGKSTLLGAFAVWHLLRTPDAAAYVAASSRDQARVIYEYARGFATHPFIDDRVIVRHLELRRGDGGGFLRVLASDAPKLHGLTPSLSVVDEYHAHADDGVYLALRSAMLKRPDARMVTVSTAGQGAESPLGRLRAHALGSPKVTRRGALTTARGPSLALLEWSVADDANADDARKIKQANPAPWITAAALREQRAALPDGAYRRYHANQWVGREGSWLPAGAWQACVGEPRFAPGEDVWIGVDVGGSRAATAVVHVNAAQHVGASIYHGDGGVLEAIARVRELAAAYNVREVVFDPWRFGQAAQELEREGMVVVAFPQSDSRMIPASAALHEAVVQGKLTLPDHEELRRHAAHAVARHSRRGWRLDKSERADNIDGIVALCMALDRATHREPEAALVAWV